MRLRLLFKVIILLCSIQLLFVGAQSVYAQEGEGLSDVHELTDCNFIPTASCQITITDEQFFETAFDRWEIQLSGDEPFSPTNIQRNELPASIAIVVDGSDVMRRGLLKKVYDSLSNVKEKLLEANPQITQSDIGSLSWSIFFIGAENADSLHTWCGDITGNDFDPECDMWRKDSNLLGNTAYQFSEEYSSAKRLGVATPFVDPLEEVIGYLVDRTGPKHIICFCEGIDAGAKPNLKETISLARDNNINIHVAHMWKNDELDATKPLETLAEDTGGEFVAVKGDITPIWQAVTQELRAYQYTLMIPLSKQSNKALINYKNDEGNWTRFADIPFPEGIRIKATESNVFVNGQPINLANLGQPQQIGISPNAERVNIHVDSNDGRLSIDNIELGGETWSQDALKNTSLFELFSAAAEPGVLQGVLTLDDSVRAAPISVPLVLNVEPPPSAILEFVTDENGYVEVSQPEDGNLAIIAVLPPHDIEFELIPSSLNCEILGGDSFDMPSPTDMTCEIPAGEISAAQSELIVSLIDQFGRKYVGQERLRLVSSEPPSPTEPSTFAALTRLPLWLWGAIGLGIIFVAAVAVVVSRLRNRQKEPPHFEPMDDDVTERISGGNFFPPTPVPDRTDATQRASHVLPVAKLTLKHAPAESRSTLASDITLYPNTLKWGIGRKKAVLLKEPGYTDAEPIEIEERTISRVHALLEFNVEIEEFLLKSDMAPNGTFVNRERLEPLEPYPLQAGDEVQFGKVAYKFEILEMDLRKAFIEFIPPGENGLVIKGVNRADFDQTAR